MFYFFSLAWKCPCFMAPARRSMSILSAWFLTVTARQGQPPWSVCPGASLVISVMTTSSRTPRVWSRKYCCHDDAMF